MKPLNYVADFRAYKLIDKVASSYYWSLYKAVYDHGNDHDDVFIKIFNFNQKDDMYPLDPLIKEILIANKCCQHKNIVPSVLCYFKERNHLCVVMPSGKTPLPSISIFKHGLPEEIVAFVIMETLEALKCMHKSGERVHGNLCCTNVFLDEEGNVKLEFPTWLTNPEVNEYPSLNRKFKKSDFCMVGTLAYDLFSGKEIKNAGCFTGPGNHKLPQLLEDFVKFCGSSGGPDTIDELMSHQFLKKFCNFHQYREDLKKLLNKKLRPKFSRFLLFRHQTSDGVVPSVQLLTSTDAKICHMGKAHLEDDGVDHNVSDRDSDDNDGGDGGSRRSDGALTIMG
ncbi:hypothetical protein POM88_032439 [Heracleum sosnowskyi]|uniref:Protein kinase domain-containing protein n=1 Tax=Heracleum sosnowskyi TaxID=360622 RepID=A0AAD8MK22_9APIA|nr:hypothetical protein POM88_032439 [Heracleum sosnowskyi]